MQLHHRVHHPPGDSQYRLEDVYHLCGIECYLGAHNRELHIETESFIRKDMADGVLQYLFFPETKGMYHFEYLEKAFINANANSCFRPRSGRRRQALCTGRDYGRDAGSEGT